MVVVPGFLERFFGGNMAQSPNQKLKLFYLFQILEEYSDSEQGITMNEILARLESRGIQAERKSIYTDFEALRGLGYEIGKEKRDYKTFYSLRTRLFDLPELKLLVDTVATSRLLTEKQSEQLIRKIEKLGSRRQAGELQREVYIYDRPKSDNDGAFDNIGVLTEAIRTNRMIDFEYFRWNKEKKTVLRENGHKTDISPEFLEFSDGKYYLVAFDTNAGMVKHYRVDKMGGIRINGKETVKRIGGAERRQYSAKMSHMFSGKEEELRFEVAEDKIGILIDEFGLPAVRILPVPAAGGNLICCVKLQVSNQLFGWLFGVSEEVRLIAPETVVGQYQCLLKQNLSSMSSAR